MHFKPEWNRFRTEKAHSHTHYSILSDLWKVAAKTSSSSSSKNLSDTTCHHQIKIQITKSGIQNYQQTKDCRCRNPRLCFEGYQAWKPQKTAINFTALVRLNKIEVCLKNSKNPCHPNFKIIWVCPILIPFFENIINRQNLKNTMLKAILKKNNKEHNRPSIRPIGVR